MEFIYISKIELNESRHNVKTIEPNKRYAGTWYLFQLGSC